MSAHLCRQDEGHIASQLRQTLPKTGCSVDGCLRQAWARGWCLAHYKRWRKNGDPGIPQLKGDPDYLSVMFWPRVDKSGEHWLWTGPVATVGKYGLAANTRAHVFAWRDLFGPIPPGMDVDHICFVRLCVKPDHLRLLPAGVNRSLHQKLTHCRRGHEFTASNTYVTPDGRRQCRICSTARGRRYDDRRKLRAK